MKPVHQGWRGDAVKAKRHWFFECLAVAIAVPGLSLHADGWATDAATVGVCEVTSTADSGAGSLRDCLSNAQAGDVITFDTVVFPPVGTTTIPLLSGLPAITSSHVTIDALSAGVMLNGSATVNENGLTIQSDYNVVFGLEISGFDDHCIFVDGSENEIGTGPTAAHANIITNCGTGVGIVGSGSGNNHVVNNAIGGCDVGVNIAPLEPFGEFHSVSYNWIGADLYGSTNENRIGILVASGEGLRMQSNRIAYNDIGVRVEGDATLALGASDNCLFENRTVGFSHAGTVINVSFDRNWWNAADGPSGVGPGSGDSIEEVGTGTVDFEPWLVQPGEACKQRIFDDGFEACHSEVGGFPDSDSDGYGDENADLSVFCNKFPAGYVINSLDCDDTDVSINPDATELCDDLDNDCDGLVDEGCPSCEDGVQNQDETGVDCGGAICEGCGDGEGCTLSEDCFNGNCVDNVCCDLACGGSCEACNLSVPGSCDSIPFGEDPDNECGPIAACDGSGSCQSL